MALPHRQRQKVELLLTFLVGLILGVALSKLLRCTSLGSVHAGGNSMEHQNSTNEPNNWLGNESALATHIYKRRRVLCMITTAPKYHKSRALHIKQTWGRRCHVLLFMSTETDEKLGTIKLGVREGSSNMWKKTREALRYVYEHHFNDADWFLKAHDDTYFIMENLRALLYSYTPQTPIYFGNQLKAQQDDLKISSGSAYVLSRAALERFVRQAYHNKSVCRSAHVGSEGQELDRCLQNVGVLAGDSHDKQNLPRFYSTSPFRVVQWNAQTTSNSTELIERDCCSAEAIAFHQIYNVEFYILEYLIYKLRPFSMARQCDTLPQAHSVTAKLQLW